MKTCESWNLEPVATSRKNGAHYSIFRERNQAGTVAAIFPQWLFLEQLLLHNRQAVSGVLSALGFPGDRGTDHRGAGRSIYESNS